MIQLAIEAALEAGKFLKESVGKVLEVERKLGQETNLVTQIDKQAETDAVVFGLQRSASLPQ